MEQSQLEYDDPDSVVWVVVPRLGPRYGESGGSGWQFECEGLPPQRLLAVRCC